MLTAKDAVTRIKEELVSLAKAGEASRLRGIVVAPEVWKAFEEDMRRGFEGKIGVSVREGNRILRYGFWVLANPNFPHKRADPYFFVHYEREVYEKYYLGREEEVLGADNRRTIEIPGLQIVEINPVWGVVKLEYGSSGSFRYRVTLDDILPVFEEVLGRYPGIDLNYLELYETIKWEEGGLSGAYRRSKYYRVRDLKMAHLLYRDFLRDILTAILSRIDSRNLVHNPPETSWIGQIRWTIKNRQAMFDATRCQPFFLMGGLTQEMEERLVGRLFMHRIHQNAPSYRIAGIAVDPRGNRWFVEKPGSQIAASEPFQFAELALRYFLPEEVLFALFGGHTPRGAYDIVEHPGLEDDYQRLQEIDRDLPEVWGNRTDPEESGRIGYGRVTGSRNGWLVSASFLDTRGKQISVELEFVPEDEPERWETVRRRYFPEGWKGWPPTGKDRALARAAANL